MAKMSIRLKALFSVIFPHMNAQVGRTRWGNHLTYLGKKLLRQNVDLNDIFFVEIKIDRNTERILQPNLLYRPLKEF